MATAMLELAAALKHDLGKYVAWQSANFDDEAWQGPLTDALVDALRSDLLRTRSRPEGDQPDRDQPDCDQPDCDQPAWEVWQAHVSGLPRPLPEPELRVVDEAVSVLHGHEAALRDEDHAELAAARSEIREAQMRIRTALRDLHRRLLRQA